MTKRAAPAWERKALAFEQEAATWREKADAEGTKPSFRALWLRYEQDALERAQRLRDAARRWADD